MTGEYPRLRHHTRRRKSGKVVTYYFYDHRPEGKPDEPLGRDFDQALKRWREIHERAPRIAGTLMEALERWEAEVLPTYTSPVTRRGYALNLARLKPWCGSATWDAIDFPTLKAYLKKRTAKTQGNRELALLQVVWNWARGEGLTALPWPAAGMERSKWKNVERARRNSVSDEVFAAIHEAGDQVRRDCMDLSSATATRLTDCLTVQMPPGDVLAWTASKTGKRAEFLLADSPVLTEMVARRRTVDALHLLLLSHPDGRKVTPTALRDRFETARLRAAEKHPKLADAIRATVLRDMRKRAADLAEDDEAAQKLLQHGNVHTTRDHYRDKPARLKPVR